MSVVGARKYAVVMPDADVDSTVKALFGERVEQTRASAAPVRVRGKGGAVGRMHQGGNAAAAQSWCTSVIDVVREFGPLQTVGGRQEVLHCTAHASV